MKKNLMGILVLATAMIVAAGSVTVDACTIKVIQGVAKAVHIPKKVVGKLHGKQLIKSDLQKDKEFNRMSKKKDREMERDARCK